MKASRISGEYKEGVENFLKFVQQNASVMGGKYLCSCLQCVNGGRQSLNDIRSHLICKGIIPTYTKWIWHSEFPDMPTVHQSDLVDVGIGDCIEDMICDLG